MRQTKRRNPNSRQTGPDVAGFFREMLTGKYPAIPAPSHRDVEEWSRDRHERSAHGVA